jgi:hypothetical protein
MERIFKGHKLVISWDDDHNGFVVRCLKLSDTGEDCDLIFVYIDYDSMDRYETMHVAKNKLAKMLKK